ncbi:MAG: hypothetical protein RR620_12025 [Clostridium sp.]
MYAKNLLGKIQILIDLDKEYEVVLDLFYNSSNKELTMIYFLQQTKINKDKLYEIFHELIYNDIIGFDEYTRCPNCYKLQEKRMNSEYNTCIKCKLTYLEDYNIEKFYLKDLIYERTR